ncbi:hypothetical protein OEZ85_007704 [Tetradesmus obliquus]|uniref:TFIIS central domain-containing protein n=1 Tax=Tetradesmus obliquus TaxID=3088 RepID=A0ABY8TGR4_TETOB|nr:hypothetical protein OEZ85_007704 [Tetradesmus obliquus]
MADQPMEQQKPLLSEEVLKVIHGRVDQGDKREKYQESLGRWWKDYSARKNDEEDMVADSLLYDERCHLPRTTPGPKPAPEPEVTAAAQPQTPPREQQDDEQQQQQQQPVQMEQ